MRSVLRAGLTYALAYALFMLAIVLGGFINAAWGAVAVTIYGVLAFSAVVGGFVIDMRRRNARR
jgi:uncharacterized RDD family membrane protein YckC